MTQEQDQWQWLDEDPVEKLLRARAPKAAVPAAAPPVQAPAPVVDSHFARAVSFEKQKRWDAAAESFRRSLEIHPGHPETLIGLGACLLHLDRAADALGCFEKCDKSERALLGKAVSLQKLERYEDAAETYRELLQVNPVSAEGLSNAIALSVARRDAGAVGHYAGRLLRVDPESKAALQGMITQAFWCADHSAAIDYCRRLLEVDPMSFEGWANLGYARQRQRDAA